MVARELSANTQARTGVPLLFVIEGGDDFVVVSARGAAREIARELGFGVVDQTRVSAAVSEIVRNVVLYAEQGTVRFIVYQQGSGHRGLEVIVTDQGPGIADIDAVLDGGFSTGGGFGRGVSGSRGLMDVFEISSTPGEGTTVRMCKWLP